MKTIFNLCAILSFGLIISAISSKQTSELSGSKVGDVKYSIFDPERFKKEHGNEAKNWALLDGSEIKDTALNIKLGMSHLPDARGRFLRGMNHEKGGVDPQTSRTVGSPQDDAFQSHSHSVICLDSGGGDDGGSVRPFGQSMGIGFRGGDASHVKYSSHSWSKDKKDNRQIIENNGKEETRPKNIALYIYVKVYDK